MCTKIVYSEHVNIACDDDILQNPTIIFSSNSMIAW